MGRHLIALLGVALAVLGGCASTLPATPAYRGYTTHRPTTQAPKFRVSVAIDPELPKVAQSEIRAAVAEWRYAFNHQVAIVEVPAGESAYLVLASTVIDDVPILGYTNNLGGRTIRLNGQLIEAAALSYRDVVLHEIGHAFGAKHVRTGRSLMAPVAGDENEVACIDVGTATEAAKFFGVNPRLMNWCEA